MTDKSEVYDLQKRLDRMQSQHEQTLQQMGKLKDENVSKMSKKQVGLTSSLLMITLI